MDGRRIDVRQVKANVVKMLADNPQGSVVIQADEKAFSSAWITTEPCGLSASILTTLAFT